MKVVYAGYVSATKKVSNPSGKSRLCSVVENAMLLSRIG